MAHRSTEEIGNFIVDHAMPEPDYVARNRAAWDRWAPAHLAGGRMAWRARDLRWGIWNIPESKMRLMQGLEPNTDVIELGCGTAEVSAWLARQGMRPVAIDISPRQVQNVESLQEEHGLRFPVFCANAERVQYEDASFDLAISEYGASLWCDPQHWLPEAHRLLRPGGRLMFLTNSPFMWTCTHAGGRVDEHLVRDYFERARFDPQPDGTIEFHPTHSDWIHLLSTAGFVVDNLIEVEPPANARARFDFVTLEWARRWPSEDIWFARKRG